MFGRVVGGVWSTPPPQSLLSAPSSGVCVIVPLWIFIRKAYRVELPGDVGRPEHQNLLAGVGL